MTAFDLAHEHYKAHVFRLVVSATAFAKFVADQSINFQNTSALIRFLWVAAALEFGNQTVVQATQSEEGRIYRRAIASRQTTSSKVASSKTFYFCVSLVKWRYL